MPAPTDIAGIKAKLDDERVRLIESIYGLSVEALNRSHPDGWSIKDILAHIALAEDVNMKFARLMVEKDSPAQLEELRGDYPDFDLPFTLDNFNAWTMTRLRAQSLEQVLAALRRTRAETLAWLDTLAPEHLEREGVHAVWGQQKVRELLRILVIHDKMHRGDIEKRKP